MVYWPLSVEILDIQFLVILIVLVLLKNVITFLSNFFIKFIYLYFFLADFNPVVTSTPLKMKSSVKNETDSLS